MGTWHTYVLLSALLTILACKHPAEVETPPIASVSLAPLNWPQESASHDCTRNIIRYRFVVWLTAQRVAVGFNVSPDCPKGSERIQGLARLVLFDVSGRVAAERDLPYEADGGQEVVADGQGLSGPGGTLLFRIEEAINAKSGVLLLNSDLKDVARVDRFLETPLTAGEHALVFQEGYVGRGPRTYDVMNGNPLVQTERAVEAWPTGTMDNKVGAKAFAYMLCQQELQPGIKTQTNIIYSGVHRQCAATQKTFDGRTWFSLLNRDEVGEIVGVSEGNILGIARSAGPATERLVNWRQDQKSKNLPWFPARYETQLISASSDSQRYIGVGSPQPGRLCEWTGIFCPQGVRMMLFDQDLDTALVDRRLSVNPETAISPDGMHYAIVENGRLAIYELPK